MTNNIDMYDLVQQATNALESQVIEDQDTSWASDLPTMVPEPKDGLAHTDYGTIDLAQISETVVILVFQRLQEAGILDAKYPTATLKN